MDRAPVVIIGAGIGGLAAAVALRRIGVETLVIERAPRTPFMDKLPTICLERTGGALLREFPNSVQL